jgi:AcrR family transcriptional regulator
MSERGSRSPSGRGGRGSSERAGRSASGRGGRGTSGRAARSTSKDTGRGLPAGADRGSSQSQGPEAPSQGPEASTARSIAPLYKRLPKGPHGITANGVAHHQRIRMHGAMIEAIATRGYNNTSVRHVIGLAGVSRRAFYEQFSNKEDCFLETFDLIVHRGIRRINQAYRSTSGDTEARMRASFGAFVEEVQTNSKALHLVVIDAQTASPAGRRRLRRTTAMFEGLLSHSFVDRSGADALPLPIVRAIVGGLRRATFVRLRDGETEGLAELAEAMLQWSLLFKSSAVSELRPRPCSNPPFTAPVALEPAGETDANERTRLLRAAIDLPLREGFENLSALRVADDTKVRIEQFFGLFEDIEDCYLAALDMLGEDLLRLVADPSLVSPQWAAAVCRTMQSLLAYMASNPARLITLSTKVVEAGLPMIDHTLDLALELATLLTEGAPQIPAGALGAEGLAGALWHTLYSEVVAGRGHRLPILTEYLAYVALTPYIGPEEAVRAIVDSRTAPARAPDGAPLGEVREHDTDQRRDHDHDDQRRVPGAEDPVDLDRFDVEDREQRGEHGEQHEPAAARELAVAAPGLGPGGVHRGGHPRLDATPSQART